MPLLLVRYNDEGDYIGHWNEGGGTKSLNCSPIGQFNPKTIRFLAEKVLSLRSMGVEVRILPPAHWSNSFEMSKLQYWE
jgi:hypothetical protein